MNRTTYNRKSLVIRVSGYLTINAYNHKCEDVVRRRYEELTGAGAGDFADQPIHKIINDYVENFTTEQLALLIHGFEDMIVDSQTRRYYDYLDGPKEGTA
jgi:hypothetical protein